MQRRQIIFAPAALATAPPLALLSEDSVAALPWFLALLFGRVAQGTIARTITTQAVRTMVVAPRLGMQVAGLLAVSTGVAYAYKEAKASAVWVTGDATHSVQIRSDSSNEPRVEAARPTETVYMGLRVRDAKTGDLEFQSRPKAVYIGKGLPLNLNEVVTDLKTAGVKLVQGFATRDPKAREPHAGFAFSATKTVVVARPEEVQWARR